MWRDVLIVLPVMWRDIHQCVISHVARCPLSSYQSCGSMYIIVLPVMWRNVLIVLPVMWLDVLIVLPVMWRDVHHCVTRHMARCSSVCYPSCGEMC